MFHCVKSSFLLCAVLFSALLPTALLAAPGSLDVAFSPGVSSSVRAIALQPDGKIVIGGTFGTVGGTVRQRLARLLPDGTVDSTLAVAAQNDVFSVGVESGGALIFGGVFQTLDALPRKFLGRLDANGTVDSAFPDADAVVYAVAPQSAGRNLVGGAFDRIGGTPRAWLGRLREGILDSTFAPTAVNSIVRTMAVQTDGKVIIGGGFFIGSGQFTSHRVARLLPDGSMDTTFVARADADVLNVALQADGKVIIGGVFGQVGFQPRPFLARLNVNGGLDFMFAPMVNGPVHSTAVQTDGKIIVAGNFTVVNDVARHGIARLHANGTLDGSFNPNANGPVDAIVLQADGKVLIGGNFSTIGGGARPFFARLENDAATQSLTVPDASRVQWQRGGASPETQSVSFELSIDGGGSWMPLGTGQRIVGGWELAGLSLPATGEVRAQARVAGGYFNGSSGLISTTISYTAAPSSVPAVDFHPPRPERRSLGRHRRRWTRSPRRIRAASSTHHAQPSAARCASLL